MSWDFIYSLLHVYLQIRILDCHITLVVDGPTARLCPGFDETFTSSTNREEFEWPHRFSKLKQSAYLFLFSSMIWYVELKCKMFSTSMYYLINLLNNFPNVVICWNYNLVSFWNQLYIQIYIYKAYCTKSVYLFVIQYFKRAV